MADVSASRGNLGLGVFGQNRILENQAPRWAGAEMVLSRGMFDLRELLANSNIPIRSIPRKIDIVGGSAEATVKLPCRQISGKAYMWWT